MKVLFVGNSHTYFNDMAALFKKMAENLGSENTEVTMLAYSGRTLKWHTEEYFSLRFALLYGNYDYCVIQQYAHPFPGVEETEEYMNAIIDMVRKCNTEPVIFMTWAARDQKENRAIMSNTYRRLAQEHDCRLAPVGEVFADIQDNHEDIDLYWKDGEHASVYGDYAIAYLMAVLLTGNREGSLVDNTAIDFRIAFDEEKHQVSCEMDRERLWINLDEEKTEIIKKEVLKRL